MAHHAQSIMLHHVGHTRGFDPLGNLVPADGVVVEHAGYLVKGDSRPIEDAGDLGHGTGGTVGQPLAGHLGPVAHAIELRVVDRRTGLKIEDDHRHSGPAHYRQHRRRQGVGRDMQEDQVNVRLAKGVAGLERPLRGVDQAKVDDHDVRAARACAGPVAGNPRAAPSALGTAASRRPGRYRTVRS